MAHGRVLLAAVCGLALLACASAQDNKNTLQDPKNVGACLTQFGTIIRTLYTSQGDLTCADYITRALNATNKAQCPEPAPIQPGSKTHECLNKKNNAAYIDQWTSFFRNCEVGYVANRGGSSESEEGFTYEDNSCLPTFNSFGAFQTWLNDGAPYGGTNTQYGAASGLRLGLGLTIGAALLALVMMLA